MTLIFDWDGTLHNTLRLYGTAFRAAWQELVEGGYAPPRHCSDEELSKYLGMNAPDMWNTFMPELPQEVKRAASDRVGREMVKLIEQGRAVLYDGVPAVLDQLRGGGHTLVFLSNCDRLYKRRPEAPRLCGEVRFYQEYHMAKKGIVKIISPPASHFVRCWRCGC